MDSDISLAIVIPTYNEAGNIEKIIRSLHDVFIEHGIDGWIVIVDDNSSDGTANIAEEIGKSLGKVIVIRRPSKLGIGSAYIDGFKFVLRSISVDYVAEMDADGSHPPDSLPMLLTTLKESNADCIVASRYVKGGGWHKRNLKRLMVSVFANALARICTGIDIKDVTSGYRIYSIDALRRLNLDKLDKGYVFQVQILYELKRRGCKILERPFVFLPRSYGSSKLKISEVFRFVWLCLCMLFSRLKPSSHG